MKKISALLLCVLLVVSVVLIAFAAQSVQMTLVSDKTDLTRGETFEITISMSELKNCRAGGIALDFDQEVFEFVSGECLVSNAFMRNVQISNDMVVGTFAYANAVPSYSGPIFGITMKVKENAAFGDFEIALNDDGCSATSTVNGADEKADTTANSLTVSVVCSHEWSDWKISGDFHFRSCSICGKTESAQHTAQGNPVAGTNTHWYLCECGAKVNEVAHSYNTGAWASDAAKHWHACACGVKTDEGAHVFTEKLQDAAHLVPGSTVKYYYDCAYCDTMGTETYTVVARGDMDCDGDVDVDDSIYLLQHVLMPDLFPLD